MVRIVGQAPPFISPTYDGSIPEDVQEFLISATSQFAAMSRVHLGDDWKAKFFFYSNLTRDLERYVFTHKRGASVESR